jgi:hypothetical protein
MRFAIAAVALVIGGAEVIAVQATPPSPSPPAFEVASVKRNVSGESRTYFRVRPQGIVTITNVTLRGLTREAYNVDRFNERFTLIAGQGGRLPGNDADPTMSARFDIQGKPPDDAAPGQQYLMLRSLLAERFKLRVHTETRPLPAIVLTLAREGRLGEHLRPAGTECHLPCGANPYEFAVGARTVRGAGTIDVLAPLRSPLCCRVGRLRAWR